MPVSILILSWNGLEDTQECLQSLFSDDLSDVEILVLDNGSDRNEADILRAEFGDRIRVYRSDENLGYAQGNNFLANLAHHDVLVFLNNDTVVRRGWMAPLIAALQDPRVGACQPKLLAYDKRDHFDLTGAAGGYLDRLGFPYARGRTLFRQEQDRGQYDDSVRVDWASGAALAIRRDIFVTAGGFDARLFAYMEEIDLAWRLRHAGFAILSVPSSVVFHKTGRSLRQRPFRKNFLLHRNNFLILLKNLPLRNLWWVIPIRILMDIAAVGYYLSNGCGLVSFAPLTGLASALALAPGFLRTRSSGDAEKTTRPFSIIVRYFFSAVERNNHDKRGAQHTKDGQPERRELLVPSR